MLSVTSGTELRRFGRGRLPRLAVAAMLLVPLLYGALYLWAFWSPTSHLDRLPVALVNSDTGASRDGTPVTAGTDLTTQLTDAGALDWVVTDAADASAGVKDGDYYFAVTIPADFSTSLASAGGSAPSAAQIDVTYNDANSFIGTTLGRSAMAQVRDAVAATAGERAVDQVLVGLGSARDGFVQAADGATSLRDASAQLGDGVQQVADGAEQARDGAASLATGASTLDAGAARVASGSADVSSGATALSVGAHDAAGSSASVATGAQGVADGLHALTASLRASDDPAAAALLTQVAPLDAGAAQVAGGAHDLHTGLGTLAASADSLASGASSLADGAAQVADGAHDASIGAAQLAGGTATVADGASRLSDGTSQLTAGSGQLADSLAAGAAQIPADSDAQRTDRASTIATPVTLNATDLATASSMGEGFAPMFVPMALFVGGIITWMLLRPLPTRALATPAPGWRVAIAGYLPAAAIGAGQVVVLLGVVGLGLGLSIGHPLGTVAFLLLVAAAFLAVQQMLIAVLGSAAGRVATIALLMLQITSASGTYPVQTTPAFFQAIHPLLPMTYAVEGLRDLITGTPDARLAWAVAYLVVVLLGALAVTAWKAGRMRTWTVARLHPALTL